MIAILITICVLLIIAMAAMLIFFNSQMKKMNDISEKNFKLMANESLEHNAQSIRNDNAEQLNKLLSPLRMRIEDFNREIQKSHIDATASRQSLSDQIDRLTKLNLSIGEEARNLTSALHGNNRVQGQWGEMVLETLLERAGLKKGVNFDTQVTKDTSGVTLRNDEGKFLRPDMIIFLPDQRNIIVDSKASLSAYLDFCDADTEPQANEAMKRHIASVKKHIDELEARKYHKSIKNAAEHVLMFIPNDGALLAAIDADKSLTEYALAKKITLVSPSQIMSVVMLVSQIWRKDAQDRNAEEIAKLGGLLYDTAKDFLSDLQGIEKSLDNARRSYDNAMSRLTGSSRSFLSRAERLRELGAKTSKK